LLFASIHLLAIVMKSCGSVCVCGNVENSSDLNAKFGRICALSLARADRV
jgi:hypothetical protein